MARIKRKNSKKEQKPHITGEKTSSNRSLAAVSIPVDKLWVSSLFLLIASVVVYGHTLDVPFYLDDFSSIQENPVIYQWDHTLSQVWRFSPLRVIPYLSLVLNYQVHAFQVAGYHVVNIAVHFLAGIAVLGLLRAVVRTAPVTDTLSGMEKNWLPLIVSALFILHPLQIQAVTYIVQRIASMAALFYVSAMAAYINARLADQTRSKLVWSGLCIIFTLCAFFSKQNTATLPFAIVLLEVIFFPDNFTKRIAIIGIVMTIPLMIWLIMSGVYGYDPFSLKSMIDLTQETRVISRESYLATQLRVLWTYIRLLFFPSGLHIDYAYTLSKEFYNPQTLLALIFHTMVIGIGLYSVRRIPLAGFGILFYYLAHLVESSVIPITDVVFEHRTYLPNLGLMIACGWLLVVWLHRRTNWRFAGVVMILLMGILAALSWNRNQVWRNPISLWHDNVVRAPENRRAWDILGKYYLQAGLPEKALESLNRAVQTSSETDGERKIVVSQETLINMVVAFNHLEKYDEALSLISQGLQKEMSPLNRSKLHVNRGNIYMKMGRHKEAETDYGNALSVYPKGLTAQVNLALLYKITNRIDDSEALSMKILAIDPNNATILQNMNDLRQLKQKP